MDANTIPTASTVAQPVKLNRHRPEPATEAQRIRAAKYLRMGYSADRVAEITGTPKTFCRLLKAVVQ